MHRVPGRAVATAALFVSAAPLDCRLELGSPFSCWGWGWLVTGGLVLVLVLGLGLVQVQVQVCRSSVGAM